MDLLILLKNSPDLLAIVVSVIGLCIGSFLNVVIYRLPVMMQQEWRQQCQQFLELESSTSENSPAINLLYPDSHCPYCQQAIKFYHNIPVVSYLFLKGHCAYCQHSISWRYPLIELLTAIVSIIVCYHFGYGLALLAGLVLSWMLITLTFIDFDHQLLPDSLTLSGLWLGLLLSLTDIFTTPATSILGAAGGYLSLWLVYQGFKLVTGKEGMGYGDFKLLAMLGAWLGWQMLPAIIFLSSLVGAVIGILLVIFKGRDHQIPIPFGPYLAVAGWIALLWGQEINDWYLKTIGL